MITKLTNGIAFAGLFSYGWLPLIRDISEGFAIALPIVSVAWIIWQFARSFKDDEK